VTITGFDLTNFRQCLEKWNTAVRTMNSQCEALGPGKCLPIHYEQLVLQPRREMEKTLKFLGIPWDEIVLHHEKLINKPGGVSLSK
jgi:protein-tyrosine sulfotransferase